MLNKRFWENYFNVYDNLNELYPYQEIIDLFIKILNPKDDDFVLDIGSGTGNFYLRFMKHTRNITGIDSSKEGVRIHLKKEPSSNIILHDITLGLPFNDSTFDKIYSNNTIYTLNNDKRKFIFNEIKRILKPGGKVVISNLNKDFNPFNIYIDHILISIKKIGLIMTLKNVIKLIFPTIKIFYYNILIKMKTKRNDEVSLLSEGEQRRYLVECGFDEVSEDIYVYSRQAILNYAKKR